VRIAFAGGGTGGHLFPGLAVADLASRRADVDSIVFFGAERGIESRAVPARGYELVAQPLTAVRGGGVGGALRGATHLMRAVGHARAELVRRRIDVVVGLGGYASAAAVIAARSAGVPVVLLEQNRDPGFSNRMLAKLAVAVCTSFAETAAKLPAGRAHLTGNPVRPEIEQVDAAASTRDTLLVFGGSGGAVSLNRAVTAALVKLAGRTKLPPIVHQTGARSLEEVRTAYREAGIAADVREFIDDMASAYRRARLAVCRSGATSVAELCATGTASVLVPFPFAAGDHQTANARALVDAGAAVLVRDDPQTAAALEQTLAELLADSERLDSMAQRAASLRRPGAAARVLDVVAAVAERRGVTLP
jgi:UDP-N-acetylglucosamine--N-acetylmuramyl-(pentapeptide) pyrophosphoryl-undecaprenol N-acetylglucosamine transferase